LSLCKNEISFLLIALYVANILTSILYIWSSCDCASLIWNDLLDQLDATFMIYWWTNDSTCFRHHCAHLQDCKAVHYCIWFSVLQKISRNKVFVLWSVVCCVKWWLVCCVGYAVGCVLCGVLWPVFWYSQVKLLSRKGCGVKALSC